MSLAFKVNLVVTVILVLTMSLFVSMDYVQERQSLLVAQGKHLFSVAMIARRSLATASPEAVVEQLRGLASLGPDEIIWVHLLRGRSVVASSSDEATDLNALRRVEWITEFEAWETARGLAVSVPYSDSLVGSMRILVEGDGERLQRSLGRTLWLHLIHGLATVAAMAVSISLVLRRLVIVPLRNIFSAINVVERGTWEVDVPTRREDEMGALTVAFNRMGRNLARTVVQLVQAEKLSMLALLATQIGRDMDASLAVIEEAASRLGKDDSFAPDAVMSEVERIRQASHDARRAAQRLDEAFVEAFEAVRSSPRRAKCRASQRQAGAGRGN